MLFRSGLNFNKHNKAPIVRAAQEGIVFSFCYGMEIMQQMGMDIQKIHSFTHQGKITWILEKWAQNSIKNAKNDLFLLKNI